MDIKTRAVYQWAKLRLRTIDASLGNEEQVQLAQLQRLLTRSAGTEWAARYGLSAKSSYAEYRERVPVIDYEACKADIERMMAGQAGVLTPRSCQWYAKSSGTTNDKSKYIPVPFVHLHDCHYKGGSDALWLYLRNNPSSTFFTHKGLVLGGSHAPIALGSNCRAGDLSSILVQHMPALGKLIRTPKTSTLLMDEWTSKMQAIITEVCRQDVGSLSGVPSWMMVMLNELLAHTGASNIAEIWPNLEVFFHGGISFAPYRETYKKLIPLEGMHYVETYNASEGFFAIQDDLTQPYMRLMLDYGIFYEFIPMEGLQETAPGLYDASSAVPLWLVETGRTYALVISTLGGLYRYLIGDTVQFHSTAPYRLSIVGRTKHYINAFGEELMVSNADKAIQHACLMTGAEMRDYTAAPHFALEAGKGWHDWLIEFVTPPSDIQRFTACLDQALQELNSDYEAKRYMDMTLESLRIQVAPSGLFERWLAQRGKLGGQHKVPRLSNERHTLESLLQLAEELSNNQ